METTNSSIEQAVSVHIDGIGLPPDIFHKLVFTLEDQLMEVFQEKSIGEFDGNDIGQEDAVLYMYGPNAEKIFSEIEGILKGYPLSQNLRVVIRYGKPGAPEREVRIETK